MLESIGINSRVIAKNGEYLAQIKISIVPPESENDANMIMRELDAGEMFESVNLNYETSAKFDEIEDAFEFLRTEVPKIREELQSYAENEIL